MIVACSGIARPIRNSALTRSGTTAAGPRTIANAAMNETSTAGTTAPTVTMTLLTK